LGLSARLGGLGIRYLVNASSYRALVYVARTVAWVPVWTADIAGSSMEDKRCDFLHVWSPRLVSLPWVAPESARRNYHKPVGGVVHSHFLSLFLGPGHTLPDLLFLTLRA